MQKLATKRLSLFSTEAMVVTLLFVKTWLACGQEYSGQGEITYRVAAPKMAMPVPDKLKSMLPTNSDAALTYHFRFYVSNELWEIRIDGFPKDDKTSIWVDASYDGTNTYVLNCIDDGKGSGSTNLIGRVYPIAFAPTDSQPLTPIWFACCSGAYLRSVKNSRLSLLWQQSKGEIVAFDRQTPARFTLLDNSLSLPAECTEYTDGFVYGLQESNYSTILSRLYQPRGGAYVNGWAKTSYSATQTTNIAGYTLPIEFQLKQFAPKPGGQSSNDLNLICEHDGVLTEVRFGPSEIRIADGMKRFAYVEDYRGVKLNPPQAMVHYQSTIDAWLPMSSGSAPYVTYQKYISGIPQEAAHKKLFMRALLIFAVCPIVIFVYNLRLKKTA